MARNSEAYDEPVDYELHETGVQPAIDYEAQRRQARERDGVVTIPRWFFYLLCGMSLVGATFGILLTTLALAWS